MTSDPELMRAYARLRDRRGDPSTPTPPVPIEEILELAEHPPWDAAGLARLDSVLADRESRDAYMMLRALAREGSRRQANRTWYVAIAAAALLAVGLPLARRIVADRGPVLRGVEDTFRLVEPVATERFIAPGSRITWRRLERATYVVELLDPNADPVWTVQTKDTTLVIPSDAQLQPNMQLSLQVLAITPEGVEQRTVARQLISKP